MYIEGRLEIDQLKELWSRESFKSPSDNDGGRSIKYALQALILHIKQNSGLLE